MNKKPPSSTPDSQQAFLEAIHTLWPLAKGSLSEVRKPCTRKGCKACATGTKHLAFIYTYRQGGKLHCLHVRPPFVTQLRLAIENGRKLEEMLTDSGIDLIGRLRGQRS
jgi:hypothetical protein